MDLGCGYGIALCFAAFGDDRRRLVGCDLDAHRIAVARQALGSLNADVTVADIRDFELPAAGLILVLDVLQYLAAREQQALLKRCCSALTPGGILVFRVHDRERGLRSAIAMAFDRLFLHAAASASDPECCRSPSTAARWRMPACSWKSADSRIVCLWPMFCSSPENLWRRLRDDAAFRALGKTRGRRFLENTLTAYHDLWLNLFYSWPVASLD